MRKQKTEIMMPTGMITLDGVELDALIQVVLGRGEDCYKKWQKTRKPEALRQFMESVLVYDRITMQAGTKEEIAMATQIIAKCKLAMKE
jgi:hypothetical protein